MRGREASFPFLPAEPSTDACVVGIVDHWDLGLEPMQLGRVVGTVVSTQKHRKLEGAKLLLVQPLTLDDPPRGIRC